MVKKSLQPRMWKHCSKVWLQIKWQRKKAEKPQQEVVWIVQNKFWSHSAPLFEHYMAIKEPHCASIFGSAWVAVNYRLQLCGGAILPGPLVFFTSFTDSITSALCGFSHKPHVLIHGQWEDREMLMLSKTQSETLVAFLLSVICKGLFQDKLEEKRNKAPQTGSWYLSRKTFLMDPKDLQLVPWQMRSDSLYDIFIFKSIHVFVKDYEISQIF